MTTAVPSKALEHAVATEVLNPEQYKDYLATAFGLSPSTVSKILPTLIDLFAYFGLVLVRTNKPLKTLVDAPEFSYTLMKHSLGDFKETVSFKGIEEQAEGLLKGGIGADPDLIQRIEEVLIPIIEQLAQGGIPDFQKMVRIVPNILLTFHLESQRLVGEILDKSGIGFEDYLDVLEDLHLNHLLRSYNLVHWCENCSRESPLIESSTGRIAPSKLKNKNCMSCDHPMSYSAFYSLVDTVKDALLCKDGFLSVLLGWCLDREAVDYRVGEYAGDIETDFVVPRPGAQTIIECKSFKREKDDQAIKSELRNALVQLDRQIVGLRGKAANVDRAFLFWNREEDIPFQDIVAKFEAEHKPLQLRIFNHLQLEDLILEIKRP